MENIVAALISAVASVFVALLNKGTLPSGYTHAGPTAFYAIPARNRKVWRRVVSILLAAMIFAMLFMHWDLAGMSILAIPLATWILSAAYPIRPLSAATVALFLCPVAFAAEPVAKLRHGVRIDNHLEYTWVYVIVAFATALIAWLMTTWRARAYWTVRHEDQPPPVALATPEKRTELSSALAKGLAELAQLHREGVISDEEFTRAKSKLLSA